MISISINKFLSQITNKNQRKEDFSPESRGRRERRRIISRKKGRVGGVQTGRRGTRGGHGGSLLAGGPRLFAACAVCRRHGVNFSWEYLAGRCGGGLHGRTRPASRRFYRSTAVRTPTAILLFRRWISWKFNRGRSKRAGVRWGGERAGGGMRASLHVLAFRPFTCSLTR